MWCTAPLDAPRGADFSPSHGRDLDFLWSGRRDSNPRPSPWQRYLAQLCHQPLYTFINVLLGFCLTVVDRNLPLLASACAFFVVRVPRDFVPQAPRTSGDLPPQILLASPWRGDAHATRQRLSIRCAARCTPFADTDVSRRPAQRNAGR